MKESVITILRNLVRALAAIAVSFLAVHNASAQAILTLTDGTNTVQIVDNGPNDLDPTVGSIAYFGSVGAWTGNITAGETTPVIGTPALPELALSVTFQSTGSGNFIVSFSDSGYTATSGSVLAAVGGETDGQVAYQTLISSSNTELTGSQLTPTQNYGAFSFSGTSAGTVNVTGPYALTQVLTFTDAAGDYVGLNANLTVTPTMPPPMPNGSISGTVWDDLNRDGLLESSEPGIDAVTVDLLQNGVIIATTTTADNGYYLFSNVPAGTYQVEVDTTLADSPNLAGLVPTTVGVPITGIANGNSSPNPDTITLAAGQSDQNIDFGFISPPPTGQISGVVWLDSNEDGLLESGEPGIASVTVDLYSGTSAVGTPIATYTTTSSGAYSFTGLPSGTYTVAVDTLTDSADSPGLVGLVPTVTTVNGYLLTPPASVGSPVTVTLPTNSSTVSNVDFGYIPQPQGSIGHYVWIDTNGDGIQGPAAQEPGIAGATVTLYQGSYPNGVPSGTQVYETTTTNANGDYLFTGLSAGTYTVVAPASITIGGFVYVPTTPQAAGGTSANNSKPIPWVVNLPLNTSVYPDANFGYVPLPQGELGGVVWKDLNGNGILETGEPGIAGVTVELFKGNSATGTPYATTTTSSTGSYLFTGLSAGAYTIEVVGSSSALSGLFPTIVDAPGSTPANQSNPIPVSVTLPTNISSDLTIDFGYVSAVTISCPAALSGMVGVPYSSAVVATNGTLPYKFSISSGALPTGLTLNATTGAITGTPTAAGYFDVIFEVTDATGQTATTAAGQCCGGATTTFTFSAPAGTLGTSQAYTSNGVTLTAYGYTNWGSPTPLYGTSQSGVENGLGIAGGSVSNGINSSTFVQLDLSGLLAAYATNPTITLGFQSGMAYNLYGSNTLGSLGTELVANGKTDQTPIAIPGFPTYRYLCVQSAACDVHVESLCFTVAPGCHFTIGKCTGEIGGYVWNDCNCNGCWDSGEPGVGGVTITLLDTNNHVTTTTTTSSSGAYLFTGLCAGTYTVVVNTSSSSLCGMIPTLGSNCISSPATIVLATNSSTDLTVNFGFKCCGPLTTYNICGWGCGGNYGWQCNFSQCGYQQCGGSQYGNWQSCNWQCGPCDNQAQNCISWNFCNVYPSGCLTVGGGCTLKFTSPTAVCTFLASCGAPCELNKCYVNPTTTLGCLAGHVVALKLCVDYSNAGATCPGLGNCTYKYGKFAGQSVCNVLNLCESVLGGAPLPNGICYNDLATACAVVNWNFDHGGDCGQFNH